MSNDDASRLYPLPFPTLASIVPPPAALPGPEPPPLPPTDDELIAGVTVSEVELDELEQSFEIPGAAPATNVLPLDKSEPEPAATPTPTGADDPRRLAIGESGSTPDVGATPEPPPPTRRRPAILDPIPGLMNARETHMLSGSSGAGKTSWLGWFIAQLLTADTVFDKPIQRPPFIVYLAGDRSLRDAEEKFIRAGWLEPVTWGIVESANSKIDTQLKSTADGASDDKRSFPMFQDALEDIARAHKFPNGVLPDDSLIIIDSMSTILGIEPSGSYLRNVAAPLAMLNRYCRKARLTVLLVHHGGKQMADKTQRYARAQDRILGSMALLGFTSTQFQLTEPELTSDPTQGLHELTVVSHSAKAFGLYFSRHVDTGAFLPAVGSLPATLDPADQDKNALQAFIKEIPTRGLKAKILELLKAVPDTTTVPVAVIQDQLGRKDKGRSFFFEALRSLVADGFVDEVIDGDNVRWVSLKPTAPPS